MLRYDALIDALAEAFRADITAPDKIAHFIPQPSGSDAKVLLMPAWTTSGERFIGYKLVNVFPDNAKRNKPAVLGSYVLMSGDTGETLAVMDGAALTAWRTACASALAARYLAREDASHLVMVGAGALAPHLVRAHRAVRPITRVTLWNRTRSHAISTAFALSAAGIEPTIADDLEEAVREADIVSCATLSPAPLVRGAWLKKGAHVDLVGAFSLKTREADDAAVQARPRLCRQPRDRAQGLGRHRHPAEEEGHRPEGHPGRPVRALPRQGEGPQAQGRDHAVQVHRPCAGGSGGGHVGVERAEIAPSTGRLDCGPKTR